MDTTIATTFATTTSAPDATSSSAHGYRSAGKTALLPVRSRIVSAFATLDMTPVAKAAAVGVVGTGVVGTGVVGTNERGAGTPQGPPRRDPR